MAGDPIGDAPNEETGHRAATPCPQNQEVRELLVDLHRGGQTVVLVTHDLELARACAHRTIHLVDGRVAVDTHAETVR